MAKPRASLTSIQKSVTELDEHLDKVDERLDTVDESIGDIGNRISGLENFKKKIMEWGMIAGLSFTTGKATDIVDFSAIFNGPKEAEAVVSKEMTATYLKNYDADTITVNLDCDFDLACKQIGLRVLGLDTPEIKVSKSKSKKARKCEKTLGIIARDFVKEELTKAEIITLKNIKRGKYFRIVADVLYDGKDLKKELFKKGYAVYYDGGTKENVDWCAKLKKSL